MFFNSSAFLPSANVVCEGYVFTPVCQSFCSQGGSASVHAGSRHPPGPDPPGTDTPPGNRHPPWDQTLPGSRHPPWQTATAADSTHPTRMHSFKQECIPVGCILITAVAATRCQYQGVGQTPPPNKRHIPGGRPLFRGRPSPCGQTNASGNITFPCGQ